MLLALAAGLAMARGAAPLFTKIGEVRSLPVAEAQQEKEAVLTGVITYVERYAIMIQDETGSTFFRPNAQQMALQVGDEVEVRGKTQMGRYIAGLGASEVRVLRRGQPLPTIAVQYDDLTAARYFYQRVAVEGIVRSLDVKKNWTALRLAMGSRILEARFAQLPPPNLLLIDAKVRLKELSAGSINDQRQMIETFMRMQSWDDIEVLDPPVPDDQVPSVAAGELLAFRPTGRPERRIAVSGTVTAVFPNGEIYLQDGGSAFAAALSRPAELAVGDRVDLAGFAEVFRFAASVVDARIRHREPGPPPRPQPVKSPDALNSSHDTRLIAVEGRVADAFKSLQGFTLVLSGTKRTVQVSVPEGKSAPAPGSRVRVTGICHVELAPTPEFVRQPGAIYLQARAADDVTVIEAPEWWTTRKLVITLAVFAGVILVAGIWNVLLHQQVRRKTAALRERIESEAALQERQRIAQEFHDTLEQDLTGLGLRLDSAVTRAFDENGRQIMVASRNLLARIQAETKNIVSSLRDTREKDLPTALEALIENCVMPEGTDVRLEIGAAPPPLAGSTLHHLHMIARESVNNALKHARATLITVKVAVEPDRMVLSVIDNGCGFDAERETRGKSGHFGCVGIRERARKIGATALWRSQPGGGTTIEIALPLKTSAPSANLARADARKNLPQGVV